VKSPNRDYCIPNEMVQQHIDSTLNAFASQLGGQAIAVSCMILIQDDDGIRRWTAINSARQPVSLEDIQALGVSAQITVQNIIDNYF